MRTLIFSHVSYNFESACVVTDNMFYTCMVMNTSCGTCVVSGILKSCGNRVPCRVLNVLPHWSCVLCVCEIHTNLSV